MPFHHSVVCRFEMSFLSFHYSRTVGADEIRRTCFVDLWYKFYGSANTSIPWNRAALFDWCRELRISTCFFGHTLCTCQRTKHAAIQTTLFDMVSGNSCCNNFDTSDSKDGKRQFLEGTHATTFFKGELQSSFLWSKRSLVAREVCRSPRAIEQKAVEVTKVLLTCWRRPSQTGMLPPLQTL